MVQIRGLLMELGPSPNKLDVNAPVGGHGGGAEALRGETRAARELALRRSSSPPRRNRTGSLDPTGARQPPGLCLEDFGPSAPDSPAIRRV